MLNKDLYDCLFKNIIWIYWNISFANCKKKSFRTKKKNVALYH